MFGFMASQNVVSAPPANSYTPNKGVRFDGINDYLQIEYTSTEIKATVNTGSFWIKPVSVGSASKWIFSSRLSTGGFCECWYNDNFFTLRLGAVSTTFSEIRSRVTTNNAFFTIGVWNHLAWSDTGSELQLYLNGSSVNRAGWAEDIYNGTKEAWYLSDYVVNVDRGNYRLVVGGRATQNLLFNSEIQEFYITANEFVDLSTDLDKFYNSGKPVDLGSDGSLPTGNQPFLYLKNPFGTFQNNLGSLGNFTVVGALEEGTVVDTDAYYPQKGALFDGTSDYLTASTFPSTAEFTLEATLSFWFKPYSQPSDTNLLYHLLNREGNTIAFWLNYRNWTGTSAINTVRIAWRDVPSWTDPLTILAKSNKVVLNQWNHIVLTFSVSGNYAKIYINGVDETDSSGTTAPKAVYWNFAKFGVGARFDGTGRIHGEMQEVLVHNKGLDLSVPSNLAKLIDVGNQRPVNLGANGELVFGETPTVYLKDPFGSFNTNYGSADDFTVIGALEEGTDLP